MILRRFDEQRVPDNAWEGCGGSQIAVLPPVSAKKCPRMHPESVRKRKKSEADHGHGQVGESVLGRLGVSGDVTDQRLRADRCHRDRGTITRLTCT